VSELLKEIIRKPGMTLSEMMVSKDLKKHYTQRRLAAELGRLKKEKAVYDVKTPTNSRKVFVWDDNWRCNRCMDKLPVCRPSLKNRTICTVCDYATRRAEDAPNEMMNLYAVRPIVSYQTKDPRGYYGVSR
jgi:hypothetical protein